MRDDYVAQLGERIGQLAEQLGRHPSEFLDVWKLSLSTGVSEEHIEALLAGESIVEWPEAWIAARSEQERDDLVRRARVFHRLQMLRETRRSNSPWQDHNFADLVELEARGRLTSGELTYLVKSVRNGVGDPISDKDLALGLGMQRQSVHKLFAQKGPLQAQMPVLLTADRITNYFGLPEGFLSRAPEPALRAALKTIVELLEQLARPGLAEQDEPMQGAPTGRQSMPQVVSARWRRDPNAVDLDTLTPEHRTLAINFFQMLLDQQDDAAKA